MRKHASDRPVGRFGVVGYAVPIAMLLRLLLQAAIAAAPAPVFVVVLHLVLRRGFDAYAQLNGLDVPMHFLGGVAIAHFHAVVLGALVRGRELFVPQRIVMAALIVALSTAAAVVWEFVELLSDVTLGTDAQGGNLDTMGDLAMGILGATVYVALAPQRRSAEAH
ncbi:MAG: hypothetical protein WD226_13410 [Planctomycetota bacterium]